MAEPAPGRRLLNATAVMASGTMASRLLGLVRAMMIAFVLGNTTLRAEVFTFAMTVPNSLYMLLAGGTLNNVLVPQIVRAVLHDEDDGKAFINRIMTAFLVALGALTVLLTIAVPWVMSLYTGADWRVPEMAEHWQSLLLMSYITMPQLFFYGVFFLIGQVLNARDVFGPMMWAPIANNVVAIAVFGAYLAIWGTNTAADQPFTTAQVALLGVGSTIGIAIQTVILLPYLKKAGFSYRPRFDLKGTGLGRTFHVAKWMVGYVALTSLAQLVVSNLASTAAPIDTATGTAGGAGFAAYQNAYLIWILPHSLLTVSLATAMLPAASRAAVAGDRRGVADETLRALRLATTFLVPASLGLFALADPITRLIFGHGTGAEDYHYVAWALMAFAIGLVPYTIQYLYLRSFYALDNTRTPFLLQIAISGANALFAIGLVFAIEQPDTVAARLALAYSLAYFLGCYLTHRALARRVPGLAGRATVRHLVRLLLASLPAALLAFGIGYFGSQFDSLLLRGAALALAAVLAVGAFFFLAKRLRIAEASELMTVLRRRPSAPDDGESPLVVEELVAAGEHLPGEDLLDGLDAPAADPQDDPELLNDDPDGVGVFIEVEPEGPPEAVLDYPAPAEAPQDEFGAEPTNLIDVGRMLAGRYQLAELLAERNGHQTWRADDTVLTRPVLIHLLAEDDPRADEVLELARRAALATDSRFLRVLDVVRSSPGEHGVYLVYEYATGQTLQRVLAGGPLTGAETAWVVREVSDALVGLHADGLHHRHLSPATVLITASGNVKIIGLLVDEALSGSATHGRGDGQAEDVQALGRL
ncbi:MAG: murein biosynthesis integral membrane protein MurJ, partial [Propionicimonas sp.]|nr:murein biosynthesis integral membrane protein MurJ [Propionicimonas sp.]